MAPLNQIKSKKPLWPFGANMMHDVVCNVSVTGKVVRQLFFFLLIIILGYNRWRESSQEPVSPQGKFMLPSAPSQAKGSHILGGSLHHVNKALA